MEGQRYRITLSTPGDWFDRYTRADVGGFATDNIRHLLATPLKRFWRENWFKPIARIDRVGNDEYVLSPPEPFTPDPRVLRAEIKARSTGELFLYVNDAVLLWPGKSDLFYRNNSGTAQVLVENITTDAR